MESAPGAHFALVGRCASAFSWEVKRSFLTFAHERQQFRNVTKQLRISLLKRKTKETGQLH